MCVHTMIDLLLQRFVCPIYGWLSATNDLSLIGSHLFDHVLCHFRSVLDADIL